MNRRAFLSFLSVAPVAVPMAAQAMAHQHGVDALLPSRFIPLSEGILGESLSNGEHRVTLRAFTPDEIRALDAGGMSEIEWQKCLSVEGQMREHDLFDDSDSSMIATADQQTHVSPETEKPIPTAIADDQCHSAQETETLFSEVGPSSAPFVGSLIPVL